MWIPSPMSLNGRKTRREFYEDPSDPGFRPSPCPLQTARWAMGLTGDASILSQPVDGIIHLPKAGGLGPRVAPHRHGVRREAATIACRASPWRRRPSSYLGRIVRVLRLAIPWPSLLTTDGHSRAIKSGHRSGRKVNSALRRAVSRLRPVNVKKTSRWRSRRTSRRSTARSAESVAERGDAVLIVTRWNAHGSVLSMRSSVMSCPHATCGVTGTGQFSVHAGSLNIHTLNGSASFRLMRLK